MREPDGVEDASLRQLVMQIAGRTRRAWLADLEPYGLSPHLARPLMVISRADPETLRLSDLADKLRITPRSTTEVVDGLAERGLVERHPSPTDRRATVLVLTAEGRRLAEELQRSRHEHGDAMFDALSERDQAALRKLLIKVLSADTADS